MGFLQEIPEDWRHAMAPFLDASVLASLEEFVEAEYASKTVYPPREQLFRSFLETPFESVKAVILGQDPYHEAGQACGVAFAVPQGVKWPASLRNIYKEYSEDLGLPQPAIGDLAALSHRGVLLLNTVLSVRSGEAGSHRRHGWEMVTDAAIRGLSARRRPVVFMLWGKPAAEKSKLIDGGRHRVVMSAHPSPLSAYRGFFGSRPFSAINEALRAMGEEPVDWRLD